MKTLHARSSFAAALLFAFAPALAAGCSAATSDGETTGQESSAILGRSPCSGMTPPQGRACNTIVCEGDDWAYKAEAQGSPCVTPTDQAGICVGEALGTCEPTSSGIVYPKYSILSVQYAPPGAASTVNYGAGTTFETTTTNSSSFANDVSVTVSTTSSVLGWVSGGISVTGDTSSTSTSSNTLDVVETTQTTFSIDGDEPAVDHGLDRIYLWLNPQMNVTFVGSDEVGWSLAVRSGQTAQVLYVTPAWLQNGTIPSDVQAELTAAGITQADYAQILGVDPFATTASATVDPTRFVFQTELPYEPVTTAGQKATTDVYAIQSTTTAKSTQDSKVSYQVGFTVSASSNFLGLFDASLKVADQMTWTSDNSLTIANGSSASATATITQPAFGYDGPVYLDVYLDSVYDTFLFVLQPLPSSTPVPVPPIVIGGVESGQAAP